MLFIVPQQLIRPLRAVAMQPRVLLRHNVFATRAPLLMISPNETGATEYLDGAAVASIAAYIFLALCLSKRLSAIQMECLNNVIMAALVLLTASSVLYLWVGVGGTLAYEQFLMGLIMTYMVLFSSIFFSGD